MKSCKSYNVDPLIEKPTLENLDAFGLKFHRERIYLRWVRRYTIFGRYEGRILKPEHQWNRDKNFKKFVNRHFFTKIFTVFHGVNQGYAVSKTTFKIFEEYAKTDYGSAVIKEVLDHKNRFKNFKVGRSQIFAAGQYDRVFLPDLFPTRRFFSPYGQLIDALAIIHHEFAHTHVFNKYPPKIVTLKEERNCVIKAENPVRKSRYFEFRYTYYGQGRTINIITGCEKPGRWTVNKYDPRILVKPYTGQAL